MLAAEAVRLVAIELLRPSNIPEGGNFPTLAGSRVFDSRGPTLTEIDQERKYTPVLSVYTQKAVRTPLAQLRVSMTLKLLFRCLSWQSLRSSLAKAARIMSTP